MGTGAPRTFDLLTASVEDIQAAVDAGALTYERLVEMHLRRIEAYDKNGPRLNAVLTWKRAVAVRCTESPSR
jgi:amidase